MKPKFLFLLLLTLYLGPGLQLQAQKFTRELLSDTIDVVHYDLRLNLTSIATQYISGSAEIKLTTPLNNVSHIPLNIKQLQVDSVLSDTDIHLSYLQTGELLRIQAHAPFSQGDTITVTVFYQGNPFHESWGGFHFYNPYAFNLGVGFESIPHNLGKTWFPCVDDFIDRATYDYHIRVNNGNLAACGGILQAASTMCDGTTEFWWKSNRSIPTYLASVAAGPYVMITDTIPGMNAQVPVMWFVRPQDSSRVAGSFINLNAITSTYESAFGPYPFERIGFTGTALGAMEHAENISYPNGSINGNLSDEWLYAHELSHMWFGNMVTCSSDADMWLNEGWARWCETLYREQLYGMESAKNNMRSLRKEVIRMAHNSEGGYLPLSPMPSTLTYGTHVYDKGATVTHGLRGYLGDSLFFAAVKDYLQFFAWQPASSEQMRDRMSEFTGVDLSGFFDFHVFGPGYNQVVVDSFKVNTVRGGYNVEVFLQQKLRGAEIPAQNCRTELGFLSASGQIETAVAQFSGFYGTATFMLENEPIAILIDPEERFNGAGTGNYKNISATGLYDFADTYFKMDVTSAADTAFVHVVHHWVAPDPLQNPQNGLTLSDYRYWCIQGIFTEGFAASGRFTYSRALSLDHTLLTSSADSLVILYRSDASKPWSSVPFTRSGPWHTGTITVPVLLPGDYTLAVWDDTVLKKNGQDGKGIGIKTYPNPATDYTRIILPQHQGGSLSITDSSGKIIRRINISPGKEQHHLDLAGYKSGNYLIYFRDKDGNLSTARLFVVN
jgi:aminopeptidase N